MGKAVCFANGMLPGEDTNWKSSHKLQAIIKINKNSCNNPEVEPKIPKTKSYYMIATNLNCYFYLILVS